MLPQALSLLVNFSLDGGPDDFNSGHLFVPENDYSAYDEDDLFDDSFQLHPSPIPMRQTLLTTLLILLFASCSQDAPRPDSALSQQKNLTSRPIEAGKVRLMLDAGIGEAEQGARLSVLGEPGNFKDKTYPKFMGNTTYYDNQASNSS